MSTTNLWKTDAHTGSTIDSFETNLRQIEHTNKLLANIENKLTSFFHRNPTSRHVSPRQNRHTDDKDPISYDPQASLPTREEYIPNIGNTLLSPIQNKDSIQHFLSADRTDQDMRGMNKYIHIIDGSKGHGGNPSTTDHENTIFTYRHKEPSTAYNPVLPGGINEYPFNEARNTSPQRSVTDRTHQVYKKKEPSRSPLVERDRNSGVKTERNGYWSPIRDRENNDEKMFYEKKLRLLEERLEITEKEAHHLAVTKSAMNNEILRLKDQLAESQARFVEDLARGLKTQEERLRKEFSEHNKYYEGAQREMMGSFEKIEQITLEKNKMEQELFEIRRQYEKLKQEKDSASLPRQLESTKNEKSLKSSLANESRFSIAKSQEGRQQSENTKLMMESLSMYKQELDALRENNEQAQVQFNQEIRTLKNELDFQKAQNSQLEDKIKMQTQILAKYQSVSLEASQAKEVDAHSVVKFDMDDLTVIQGGHKRTREQSRDLTRKSEDRSTHQLLNNLTGSRKESDSRTFKRHDKNDLSSNKTMEDRQSLLEVYARDKTSSLNLTGDHKREQIPFTNYEIKSGLASQDGNGVRGRRTPSKEIADLNTAPEIRKKSRSKTGSKSKRKASEDFGKSKRESVSRNQKSPGTAYEEFEEELRKVKGIVSERLAKKKSRRQASMEKETKSRRSSQEAGKGKDKVESKVPSTARGTLRSSPVVTVSLKSSTNSTSRLKSSRK